MGALGALQKDFVAFQDSFELTGKHLTNASRNLEDARIKLQHLGWKLAQVEEDGPMEEPASPTIPDSIEH